MLYREPTHQHTLYSQLGKLWSNSHDLFAHRLMFTTSTLANLSCLSTIRFSLRCRLMSFILSWKINVKTLRKFFEKRKNVMEVLYHHDVTWCSSRSSSDYLKNYSQLLTLLFTCILKHGVTPSSFVSQLGLQGSKSTSKVNKHTHGS